MTISYSNDCSYTNMLQQPQPNREVLILWLFGLTVRPHASNSNGLLVECLLDIAFVHFTSSSRLRL